MAAWSENVLVIELTGLQIWLKIAQNQGVSAP